MMDTIPDENRTVCDTEMHPVTMSGMPFGVSEGDPATVMVNTVVTVDFKVSAIWSWISAPALEYAARVYRLETNVTVTGVVESLLEAEQAHVEQEFSRFVPCWIVILTVEPATGVAAISVDRAVMNEKAMLGRTNC